MTHRPISTEAEANAERARVAFTEHNWSEAIELLRAADAGGALTAADLDALGESAWWMGRLGEAIEARERAFAAHSAAGDLSRAAATALALATDYSHRLQSPVASAWVQRAERLLRELPESREHGYLQRPYIGSALARGSFDEALLGAERLLEIAHRLGDPDLEALGLQDKGRVLIALGDAAGHGVNAAVAMAQASSALRAFLTAGRPRSAMYKLDQYLHSLIGPGFVTLCMVDVNPKTRKARLTNAGHMPPIHVTRKGIRRLNKGRGSPLGVGSVDRISPARVRFRRDDRLFLYTDGLVERRGDSIDKGIARLYWVIDEAPEDLDDACDHILEQMRPPGGFEDDVALLAVRFTRRRDG